jgi:hypothetical protein
VFSVTRVRAALCKETSLKKQFSHENGNSVQLSVGDSYGKFVVEEELEVGL